MNCLDKHASSIAQIAALFLLLAVVVILILHGTKEDSTVATQLVTGAVGIAGAIAGFSKHSDTPAASSTAVTLPNSTSQPTTIKQETTTNT